MHAQLMSSSGKRLECEPGEMMCAPHRLPSGHRGLAARIMLHPPAARLILAAERQRDASLRLDWSALHHRPIGLADLAVAEQQVEVGQRLAVTAEHQAARGLSLIHI